MPTIQNKKSRTRRYDDGRKAYGLRVDPELHRTSKANAARLGETLQDYTIRALIRFNAQMAGRIERATKRQDAEIQAALMTEQA